jgi:hypothetical protein
MTGASAGQAGLVPVATVITRLESGAGRERFPWCQSIGPGCVRDGGHHRQQKRPAAGGDGQRRAAGNPRAVATCPDRMAAAARASLGTRLTQAALHDTLPAAYATEPVPLPGGSTNWPTLTLG